MTEAKKVLVEAANTLMLNMDFGTILHHYRWRVHRFGMCYQGVHDGAPFPTSQLNVSVP